VVAYGKVGYLRAIVRIHIKPAHPKRHPTPSTKEGHPAVTVYGTCPYTSLVRGSPQLQWGAIVYSGFLPLPLYILWHRHLYSFYWVKVNISGVRLSALTAATPTYYLYYITITTTCQVVVRT